MALGLGFGSGGYSSDSGLVTPLVIGDTCASDFKLTLRSDIRYFYRDSAHGTSSTQRVDLSPYKSLVSTIDTSYILSWKGSTTSSSASVYISPTYDLSQHDWFVIYGDSASNSGRICIIDLDTQAGSGSNITYDAAATAFFNRDFGSNNASYVIYDLRNITTPRAALAFYCSSTGNAHVSFMYFSKSLPSTSILA